MQKELTRRSLLSMAQFAPFFAVKPAPPQPTAVQGAINGIVVATDYPSLQAAADAAFGTVAAPHGTSGVLTNRTLYIPGGQYLPPSSGAPVLDLRYLHGGRIIGSGRFVTKLIQPVAGLPVIRTNGCGYAHFEGMLLQASAGGTCLDLNWDGSAGGAALQSNTFEDLIFLNGSIGCLIASNRQMGSENEFSNCFWQSNTTAGLCTAGANALQQTVIGGDFQGCGIGIWVGSGSVSVVSGVGFQEQTVCDIQTDYLGYSTMAVAGCRSESRHFIKNNAGQTMHVSACGHTGAGQFGDFLYQVGGQVVVSACRAAFGRISARYWAQLKVENSGFNRADWLDYDQLWYKPNNSRSACIELENVWANGGATEIRKQRIALDSAGNYKTYEYQLSEVI